MPEPQWNLTLLPMQCRASSPLLKRSLYGSFSFQDGPDSVSLDSLHTMSPWPELSLPSLLRNGKNYFDFGMSGCRGSGFKVRRQRAGTIQFSPLHLSNAKLDSLDSHGLRAIHVWSVASAPPRPENILMEKKQGQPERGDRETTLQASTETTH